jgi:TM2 domain-containing membrane protein YozV
MPFCETCGVEGGGDYCPACGEVRSFAAKAVATGQAFKNPTALQAQPAPAAALQVTVAPPHHGVPALMSFFIPGLGQLVKGHVAKGLGTWGALFAATVGGFLVGYTFLAIPVVWIWSTYDAYKSNSPKLGT